MINLDEFQLETAPLDRVAAPERGLGTAIAGRASHSPVGNAAPRPAPAAQIRLPAIDPTGVAFVPAHIAFRDQILATLLESQEFTTAFENHKDEPIGFRFEKGSHPSSAELITAVRDLGNISTSIMSKSEPLGAGLFVLKKIASSVMGACEEFLLSIGQLANKPSSYNTARAVDTAARVLRTNLREAVLISDQFLMQLTDAIIQQQQQGGSNSGGPE